MLTQPRTIVAALLAAALAAPLAGCDNPLQEEPKTTISPANFYTTMGEAEAALVGAYSTMRNNDQYPDQRNWVMLTSFPSPVITYAQPGVVAARDQMDNWSFNAGHEFFPATWNIIYAGVLRANAVIDNVPRVPAATPAQEARKAQIIAEARFLRAFHYFNALRLWGPVPLVVAETRSLEGLDQPRAGAEEMYSFLIKELSEMQAALPAAATGANYGRATKAAAQAYLGLLYLHRASGATPGAAPQPTDLASSIAEFRKVVASPSHALAASYADLFDETKENTAGMREPIFCSVHTQQLDSSLPHFMAPAGSGWLGGQFPSFQAEWPFLNRYHAADRRKAVTWLMSYFDRGRSQEVAFVQGPSAATDAYHLIGPMPNKHLVKRVGAASGRSEKDFCMMRLGGVMLYLAEAINRKDGPTGEALGLVNQIRARAGVPPLAAMGRDAFARAVYDEMLFELATEGEEHFIGQRNWDFYVADVQANSRVTGLPPSAVPTTRITVQPHQRVFPIPQAAIDVNPNLQQNAGY